MNGQKKKFHWGWFLFFVFAIALTRAVVAKWDWIQDYVRGLSYEPTAEMAAIRDSLNLTGRGAFLFKANQPALNESAEFNEHCLSDDTEVAILGCYVPDENSIYVYNIVEKSLDGIREVTTAHELLHAVFARMSENDKEALRADLERVYSGHKDILEDELDTYTESERFEELYVRAGTEIADLPDSLEKHYGEIFNNQDTIVAFYNSYIAVFNSLSKELDELEAVMESLNSRIEQATNEYEARAEQLNARITSFNNCADTAGCFETEEEFYGQRAMLVDEQQALEAMYEEIGGLIDEYNAKVEIYNADVLQSEKLNTIINSNSKPQEIE